MNDSIHRLIKIFGTQRRIAEVAGVSSQAVHKWKQKGLFPVGRCKKLVNAADGVISLKDLRPDIF